MRDARSTRTDLILFAILAASGTAAMFLSVKIPHTEVFIEGRWVFGFVGFALLGRWWLALLLAGMLSMPYLSDVPFAVGFFGNLGYAIPCLLVMRPFHAKALAPAKRLWVYTLGWFVLVLACYQAFNTPVVWGVSAMLNDAPVWPAVLEGWRTQPFFVESLLVGAVSASILAVARTNAHLQKNQRRLDHLNRILLAIRNVNQLITHEKDRGRLLQETCRLLTETRGFQSAWMALLAPQRDRMALVTSAGFDAKFEPFAERLRQGTFPKCVRRCLEHDDVVIVMNPATECEDCPVLGNYRGRVVLTRRVGIENHVSGVLAVSVPAKYAMDPQEQSLFTEVADDVALALRKLDAEDALLRLDRVVKTMPHPVSLVSRDYRYVAANQAYAELYGVSPEEILGQTVASLIGHTAFEGQFKPHIDRCLAGEAVRYEVKTEFPGKGQRWIETEYYPYRTETGNIAGIVSHGHDITERKCAEESVRDNEERYRTLFETAHDAIFIMDHETFVACNDATVRVFGCREKSDILGHSPEEFSPARQSDGEDSKKKAYRLCEAALEGTPQHFEWTHNRFDGTPFEAEVSLNRLRLQGRILLQAIVRDVTEQRRYEHALRESERQKNLILNSTAEMVVYYDTDLRIVWANRAAGEMAGRSPKELVGVLCGEFWYGPGDAPSECAARTARDTRSTQQREDQSLDGRWWLVRCYPVFDDHQQVMALVEFGQDITDRKVAEQERKELESQLRQSQKLDAVGQLAGGLAHDFNNILTAILGNLELGRDRIRDELGANHDVVGSMTEIERAAQRAATLTRQLLTFSRRDIMQPEVLNLNDILTSLDRMLRPLVTENIKFEMLLDSGLKSIRADAGRLEQTVVNLVINAVQAMPDGGRLTLETHNVELDENYVRLHASAQTGSHVLLAISDTGHGMDEATLEHIFEPFFTTKTPDKGTGLGLATVHGIVNQSGGHIRVYSEVGRGTTFRVYLPCVDEDASTPSTEPERTAVGGPETILLCEDDRAVGELVAQLLRTAGYTVILAGSGREGIIAAESHEGPIDLLITDVIMPDMNGRDLATRLRSIRTGIPTLFISGYTSNVIAHHGVLDEGVEFLEKPFTRQRLLTKIRAVLGTR